MSAPPVVSVLMTAFNREEYVGAAIESVLAQTFGDFELIVVDDRSADRTVEIARTFESDRRVRVVVNERNLGDYPNRNHAATFARGRFIKYQDSDDLMYPHCLSTMVRALDAMPTAGLGLALDDVDPPVTHPMLLTPRMCFQRDFLGGGLFQCGASSALFRAEVFRALGGFPEEGAGSDFLMWLRACTRLSVAALPGGLFWYRVHAGQEMQSRRAALEYARSSGAAWSALTAPDCPLTSEEREQAKRNWAYIVARGAYREFRAGRWEIGCAQLRHAGLTPGSWLRYLRPPRRNPLAGSPEYGAGARPTPPSDAGLAHRP